MARSCGRPSRPRSAPIRTDLVTIASWTRTASSPFLRSGRRRAKGKPCSRGVRLLFAIRPFRLGWQALHTQAAYDRTLSFYLVAPADTRLRPRADPAGSRRQLAAVARAG